MDELRQHIVGFRERSKQRADAVAGAAAPAEPTAEALGDKLASAAAAPAATAAAAEEPIETISTARQRALDALPAEIRRAIVEGSLVLLNGYLATAPLEQVRY